jgi:cytochrome P450
MTIMPSALPRLIDPVSLGDDPLAFLAGARSRVGDAIILGEGAPFFSPAADCPGVVALFGSHYHRQVLGDYRSFVSTGSAARALGLPENIVNLNRSLHSMQGRQHEAHKAVLAGVITPALLIRQQASIVAVVDTFAAVWREAGSIPIFAGIRSLIAEIAVILLFGEAHPSRGELQSILVQHFDVRRLLSANRANGTVAEIGNTLNAALNSAIAAPDGKGRIARPTSG